MSYSQVSIHLYFQIISLLMIVDLYQDFSLHKLDKTCKNLTLCTSYLACSIRLTEVNSESRNYLVINIVYNMYTFRKTLNAVICFVILSSRL